MNRTGRNRLFNDVAVHKVTANEAIRRLVAAGHERDLATELVLIALGGGDVIAVASDGTERYEDSGRTVAEVDADMHRT